MVYTAGGRYKSRGYRRWAIGAVLLLLLSGAIIAAQIYMHRSTGPVPKSIVRAVNFPVYYPSPNKLPAGYHLDTDSFTHPVKSGVAYTVSYSRGRKIVFSVQPKPADSELQTFNSNYIPLRIDYQTSLGQAEIGAYHGQTLASLPVLNGPWIVITAPSDINQNDLKQVLKAIQKP